MFKKILPIFLNVAAILVLITMTVSCCNIKTTAAVKLYFSSYEKVAIIWQDDSGFIYETLFLSYWMENFPKQTLVERKELLEVIREQDLLRGRLNEETRARLRMVLGVNAIVVAHFNLKEKTRLLDERRSDLSIKVIDTETGEISASAISQGNPRCNNSIIIEAVRIIKEKMEKSVYSTFPNN